MKFQTLIQRTEAKSPATAQQGSAQIHLVKKKIHITKIMGNLPHRTRTPVEIMPR